MKLLFLSVLLFFLIDLKFYKPPDFIHYKMAMGVLFIHHWLIMMVLLGWLYFPLWLYGGIAVIIIVGWRVFNNRCILSDWTKKLGPEEYEYCPYMGLAHHALGLQHSCIEQYWGRNNL